MATNAAHGQKVVSILGVKKIVLPHVAETSAILAKRKQENRDVRVSLFPVAHRKIAALGANFLARVLAKERNSKVAAAARRRSLASA